VDMGWVRRLMVSCFSFVSALVRCRLPMKVGSCRAAFPKFYYDVTNQSCRDFIYGGCEANANNFDSKEECETACKGVTGNAHTTHWNVFPYIFRLTVGSCKGFTYGGCRGNKNNYVTEQSCMGTCTVAVWLSTEHCLLMPDAGPCRAAFPMFFYDPSTDTCQSFIYGGCHGNGNRYSSKEDCMSRCSFDGKFRLLLSLLFLLPKLVSVPILRRIQSNNIIDQPQILFPS
uniref:BPTI/Kunitz inhibitor domain-containing protein n=1 Tax=Takifugu rubripes TaxID=31033 RepID=A0A674PPN7_TAKRU